MADIDKTEKRLIKLESRFDSAISDLNKVNQRTHDEIIKLEKRVEKAIRSINKVNATTHKHVTTLEKRFGKFDKTAKKMGKRTEPRLLEKNTMKLVDQALKAYDQKRGKR